METETKNLPATQYVRELAIADYALTVEEAQKQVDLIKLHMARNLVDGKHYGTIPGCGDKPSLFKPGAEMLFMIFQFSPKFHTEVFAMPNDHREYRSRCEVFHRPTGALVASANASCSTMEAKYRYRTENTWKEVPAKYWDSRDNTLLGGSTFKPKKVKSKWYITQQVEHSNPADYYNTCLKMSEKRSAVATALFGTGASFLFTQDIEDMNIERDDDVEESTARTSNATGKTKTSAAKQQTSATSGTVKKMTEPQKELLMKMLDKHHVPKAGREQAVTNVTKGQTIAALSSTDASKLIEYLMNKEQGTIATIQAVCDAFSENTPEPDEPGSYDDESAGADVGDGDNLPY